MMHIMYTNFISDRFESVYYQMYMMIIIRCPVFEATKCHPNSAGFGLPGSWTSEACWQGGKEMNEDRFVLDIDSLRQVLGSDAAIGGLWQREPNSPSHV